MSGVIVGRSRVDELSVRLDAGTTISVRVHPEVGSRVDIGERAELTLRSRGISIVRRAA